MAAIGRPTRLTRTMATAITALMVDPGLTLSAAAERLEVGTTTVGRWKQRGEQPDAPAIYREFRAAVTRAIAEREQRLLAVLDAAQGPQVVVERRTKQVLHQGELHELTETVSRQVPGDWRAAAWKLEHLPDHKAAYGNRIEVTGEEGGPIEMRAVPAQPMDEAMLARIEEVLARCDLTRGEAT